MTIPTPVQISDLSVAFPADALDYMPAWDDIPDDFKDTTPASDEWYSLAWTWFSKGLESKYTGFLPVEVDGTRLDGETISRQISAILGSYAPKHEHKMAAVAWLLSVWIEGCVYGPENTGKDDLTIIGDFFSLDEWIEHIDTGKPTHG